MVDLATSSAPPTAQRPHIVLVDDDDALREALSFLLEIEGFGVQALRSGEQLVALDLPTGPVCLVIDHRLGEVSGLDALEKLRSRGVRSPAILITSYADPALRRRAMRFDAAVIEKPLLGDALLARVRELLAVPQDLPSLRTAT
jgi:FixJ family two-component response regulator